MLGFKCFVLEYPDEMGQQRYDVVLHYWRQLFDVNEALDESLNNVISDVIGDSLLLFFPRV